MRRYNSGRLPLVRLVLSAPVTSEGWTNLDLWRADREEDDDDNGDGDRRFGKGGKTRSRRRRRYRSFRETAAKIATGKRFSSDMVVSSLLTQFI